MTSSINTNTNIKVCQPVYWNINGGDVQRKNVVNNVDKSSLWKTESMLPFV